MKREHWPEVGWRRRRAWAEAWAGMARLEQRLQDESAACFDGVGQGRGWAGSGEAERWELWLGLATAWDGDGWGCGWRRRWLGLGLATAMATALALVLRGDESLMRDEGWWERSEGWGAWWEMRELDEMMKKKKRGFRRQEHGRSWIKRNKRIIYVCIILIRERNKKSFFFLDDCYSAHL